GIADRREAAKKEVGGLGDIERHSRDAQGGDASSRRDEKPGGGGVGLFAVVLGPPCPLPTQWVGCTGSGCTKERSFLVASQYEHHAVETGGCRRQHVVSTLLLNRFADDGTHDDAAPCFAIAATSLASSARSFLCA